MKTTKSALKYPAMTQKGKDDEYISGLQRQVYYLELEMKLMKDREAETKNKVGGYEVLFRDGVPLNENFLALKTKYTNERDHFENVINALTVNINSTENENQNLQLMIERTNKSYYDIIQHFSNSNNDYGMKIFDINGKVFNELNSLTSLTNDKNKISKDMFKFSSENVHFNRAIEKNNLFKEDIGEKNEKIKKHDEEKFQEIDRLTERSVLEYDALERKLMNNSRLKKLEDENMELLSKITKLESESHMSQAKIAEIQNTQVVNKKHLLDEELTRNIHLKVNEELNGDLDNLSKLNEEKMKEKVKESEAKQILVIKNQISDSELKMGLLLNKYKEEETIARNLLEEKNALMQKISSVKEDIDNQNDVEVKTKGEIIEVKDNINQLNEIINDNNAHLEVLVDENKKMSEENEKYEKDIKDLRVKIDEIQQKIELNSMLKDIDIGELKMLTQNNAIVNNSINTLITKWDKVHAKLSEIEQKNQNK